MPRSMEPRCHSAALPAAGMPGPSTAQSDFAVVRTAPPDGAPVAPVASSTEASARATRWILWIAVVMLALLAALCAVGPHIPSGE